MNDFDSDITQFKESFAVELASDAAQIGTDSDIYAYAVEVPDDLSNLYVCTAFARTSEFNTQWHNTDDLAWWESLLFCFGDKYTDPTWNYQAGQESFGNSQRQLAEMQTRHFTSDLTEAEELRRRDLLYSTVLDVMSDVLPSNPRLLKLIILSDDEHPIQRASFNRLNSGTIKRRLWLMYNFHAGSYLPIAFFSNVIGKLFR